MYTQCLYVLSSRSDADKYTYTLNLKFVDDIWQPLRFVANPIPFDEFADAAPKDHCNSIQFESFKRFFIDGKFEFHYNIEIYERSNETSQNELEQFQYVLIMEISAITNAKYKEIFLADIWFKINLLNRDQIWKRQ